MNRLSTSKEENRRIGAARQYQEKLYGNLSEESKKKIASLFYEQDNVAEVERMITDTSDKYHISALCDTQLCSASIRNIIRKAARDMLTPEEHKTAIKKHTSHGAKIRYQKRPPLSEASQQQIGESRQRYNANQRLEQGYIRAGGTQWYFDEIGYMMTLLQSPDAWKGTRMNLQFLAKKITEFAIDHEYISSDTEISARQVCNLVEQMKGVLQHRAKST